MVTKRKHIFGIYIPYLLVLILVYWQQGSDFISKGGQWSLLNARFEPRVSETESPADWMPADKSTDLSRIRLKHELNSSSLWSASIQPTWPHCRYGFIPGPGDIYVCWYYVTYIYNMNHIIAMSLAKMYFPNTLERCWHHFKLLFYFVRYIANYLFDNFSFPNAISERVSNLVLHFNIATTLPHRSKWLRGMSLHVL